MFIKYHTLKTIIFCFIAGSFSTEPACAAPIEDIDGRPVFGSNSGTIPEGYRVGGGVWNATIGDNVYIYTNLDANSNPANGHGLYGNLNNVDKGGNGIKIDVEGKDGDGIRSNPGGITNAQNSRCVFELDNDLTIWVRGESGDCVNLNGFSTLTVGDNAKFYAWGTYRSAGNGSYGLRANMGSTITIGKNGYVETTAESSHALFTTNGLFSGNTYDASISMDDGAEIVTKGDKSHGVSHETSQGSVTFKGSVDIHTQGDGSYGINNVTSSGTLSVAGAGVIRTEGQNAHGIYTSGSSSTLTLGTSTRIDNTGTGSHSIYAYNGKVTGTGQFTLGAETGNGSLYARSGTIDLVMNDSSRFTGYTNFENTSGTINLQLQDGTIWSLSDSSSLTSLSVDGSSSVVYTIGGTDADKYTSIYGRNDISLEAGSVMKVVLDGYAALEGDEFTLLSVAQSGIYSAGSIGDVIFDFTKAILGENLAWDTSTFHEDGTIRVIASTTPIPETSSVLFATAGLAMVFSRRRKRL